MIYSTLGYLVEQLDRAILIALLVFLVIKNGAMLF